jgi:hypothetical protein
MCVTYTNLFMINITIGSPTWSKRYHTSHNKQKDLNDLLQFGRDLVQGKFLQAMQVKELNFLQAMQAKELLLLP